MALKDFYWNLKSCVASLCFGYIKNVIANGKFSSVDFLTLNKPRAVQQLELFISLVGFSTDN